LLGAGDEVVGLAADAGCGTPTWVLHELLYVVARLALDLLGRRGWRLDGGVWREGYAAPALEADGRAGRTWRRLRLLQRP